MRQVDRAGCPDVLVQPVGLLAGLDQHDLPTGHRRRGRGGIGREVRGHGLPERGVGVVLRREVPRSGGPDVPIEDVGHADHVVGGGRREERLVRGVQADEAAGEVQGENPRDPAHTARRPAGEQGDVTADDIRRLAARRRGDRADRDGPLGVDSGEVGLRDRVVQGIDRERPRRDPGLGLGRREQVDEVGLVRLRAVGLVDREVAGVEAAHRDVQRRGGVGVAGQRDAGGGDRAGGPGDLDVHGLRGRGDRGVVPAGGELDRRGVDPDHVVLEAVAQVGRRCPRAEAQEDHVAGLEPVGLREVELVGDRVDGRGRDLRGDRVAGRAPVGGPVVVVKLGLGALLGSDRLLGGVAGGGPAELEAVVHAGGGVLGRGVELLVHGVEDRTAGGGQADVAVGRGDRGRHVAARDRGG